jgi:hypothetical protein
VVLELSVLPGLPPYGKLAQTFSATGLGRHSEGLVVKIQAEGGHTWVANFVRGLTKFDFVAPHPNGHDALVIAGGQAYVVDPTREDLRNAFGGAIVNALRHPTRNALVLNHQDLDFEAIGSDGRLWKTRRISWDGFRSIEVEGTTVRGEAWDLDDTWHPFKVDLETGEVVGGSYYEASPGGAT